MANPFGSEGDAFTFVLLTLVAFSAIAVAGIFGGAWIGVAVWLIVSAAALVVYARRRDERGIRTAPAHRGDANERRILVLATDPAAEGRLAAEIERARSGRTSHVHVVCPTLTSSVRSWASDVDCDRLQAARLLERTLSELRAAGITADGEVGDENPMQAIEDALRTFGADEIIVSTGPERRVATQARERFALPVDELAAPEH
jgi:GABA permease